MLIEGEIWVELDLLSGRVPSNASLLRAGGPGITLGSTSAVSLRLLIQRFMEGTDTPKTFATSWRGIPRSTASSTLIHRSFEYGFMLQTSHMDQYLRSPL
jgi:hypothetical protein